VWTGARRQRLAWWLGSGVVAVAIYFWRYTSHPLGLGPLNAAKVSPGFTVSHPLQYGQFVLVLLGKVVPNDSLTTSTVIGAALLIGAAVVVCRSVRERSSFVPIALIAFGVLFDLFVAVGRLSNGLVAATLSRYTMPNVLVLVAVISYGYVHVRSEWMRAVAMVGIASFFALTVVSGLNSARAYNHTLQTGARLIVNRGQVPTSKQGCFDLWGYFVDVGLLPTPQPLSFVSEAQADHLGAFGTPYATYRAEGLPEISQCN
jgi:hypothetical protein